MSQQEGCLPLIPLISVFEQLEKEKVKGNQLTLLNLKTAVDMEIVVMVSRYVLFLILQVII